MRYSGLWFEDEKIGTDCKVYNQKQELIYRGSLYLGNKEGFGRSYWVNGALNFAGSFKQDQLWGKSRLYYRDGALRRFGNFVKDRMYGMGCEHYQQGQIEARGYFHQNALDYSKFFILYYPNGQISEVGQNKFNIKGKLIANIRGQVKINLKEKKDNV